ncbi:hypothetical protein GCM10007856_30710 [Azospirillum oryzae]|nr:hypothetical protein GCM10007856_30710 [Azospirillum oryzae]
MLTFRPVEMRSCVVSRSPVTRRRVCSAVMAEVFVIIEAMGISIREMHGAFLTPGPFAPAFPIQCAGARAANSRMTEPV